MPQIQTNATTLNYRWDGPEDGPVVLMAHALGADLAMWDPQVAPLTMAGFRVLRYDHRGHGQSAVPQGPYALARLSADAVGLMDNLGLKKVHFVGLSLGGMVGQVLGADFGHRLLSLTLCSTSSFMPPREIWEERIRTVSTNGLAAVADATIDRWFTQTGQQRLPSEVKRIRNKILNTSADGFCACCAAIRDTDLRGAIADISIPALIVVGEHDQGTPVSAARFIHEAIPHSRIEVTADAAHLQNIEQAEVFNETLLAFLDEVARDEG